MLQETRTQERLRLSLTGLGRLGEAMAEYDGKPVFVFGGIPGEEVEVEVVRRHRRYIAAQVVEVLVPSPHRVSAPCPYFGPCTGCQWQPVDYRQQLEWKQQVVVDALRRVGGLEEVPVPPTIPALEPFGYRNHARFTVGPGGALGFVHRESRRFVRIEVCMLMHPHINQALGQLQGRCGETTQLSLRCGIQSGGLLVQPTLHAPEVPLPTGQQSYIESLKGHDFHIAASSFFQVNTRQAERLVELVAERLHLSGRELLVDAYAGVGTFAVLLASQARRVVAIEESLSAVRNAQANAQGIPNVEFLQAKVEEALRQLGERPDAVILDPPRAGCHRRALDALVELAPPRVVYVSCDPATLARDLKVLCQGPYRVEEVQPVDMFPQTHHLECVAILSVRELPPLVLASESPRRRELLTSLGVDFRVAQPEVDEAPLEGEAPEAQAERLALLKARAVVASAGTGVVIGADTLVVLDGLVLGKPRDAQEARAMLWSLRGRMHQVVTGVALVEAGTGRWVVGHRVSRVAMRPYSEAEVEAYVASADPLDKAGAYAVQDPVFQPASRVEGCYLNVVGMPLCTLLELSQRLGVPVAPGSGFRASAECTDCPLRREGVAWE
ncbi:MAG: 23S rRNA (uracil(1939)-C(5))-methyltransferase RlmD [Dehalococcoidia bacterium]